MKIDRILVGIDFSEGSMLALDHAWELACHQEADLVLLHSMYVPVLPLGLRHAPDDAVEDLERRLQAGLGHRRDRLDRLREQVDGRGAPTASLIVVDEPPARALYETVDEAASELIVVGARGNTDFASILLGGVAERVVRHSPTPVLVVRPGGEIPAGGYRRALVGTDFSPASQDAFAVASALCADDARVDVAHCWKLPDLVSVLYEDGHPYWADPEAMSGDIEAGLARDARSWIAANRIPTQANEFHLIPGRPVSGLLEWIGSRSPDLVSVGRNGRGRTGAIGAVAVKVLRHARRNVLVVPGTPGAGR